MNRHDAHEAAREALRTTITADETPEQPAATADATPDARNIAARIAADEAHGLTRPIIAGAIAQHLGTVQWPESLLDAVTDLLHSDGLHVSWPVAPDGVLDLAPIRDRIAGHGAISPTPCGASCWTLAHIDAPALVAELERERTSRQADIDVAVTVAVASAIERGDDLQAELERERTLVRDLQREVESLSAQLRGDRYALGYQTGTSDERAAIGASLRRLVDSLAGGQAARGGESR